MTSYSSLFSCPSGDVTYPRVLALLEEAPTESLTLEFKEQYSQGVPKTVAAMANSYGGLLVIGIRDAGSDRVAGVTAEAITQIANGCHQRLEPPWEPEVIPIPIPTTAEGTDARFLIVVRVDPARAPRPILLDGTVPVRLNGRNATAGRDRAASLFAGNPFAGGTIGRRVARPTIARDSSGSPTVDFIIRTGMWVPVDEAAPWRPLSERAIDGVVRALDGSALHQRLLDWNAALGSSDLLPFRRAGLNRSRRARLVWQSAVSDGVRPPVEAVVEIVMPSSEGAPISALEVTADVAIRAHSGGKIYGQVDAQNWLDVPSLYTTIEALIASMSTDPVVGAIALVAGVDPVLVPQPASLDLVTGEPVDEILSLYGLVPVPDAGTSHGTNLLGNPGRNLADSAERRDQIDDWVAQIGMDAGLQGMEAFLIKYHESR